MSTTIAPPVPSKTSFGTIGDFFKDATGDGKNPMIFFGILLIATMPFVQQQKLIFVGYILVAILYLVIFINVIYGAFKTGVYGKIKGVLSELTENEIYASYKITSFGFVKFAFMLFFIVINTMSWMSSPKKGVGGNIAGAVLMPLAPIILYFGVNHFTGSKLDQVDIFKSIVFFLTVTAFIGLVIYNYVSLTQVVSTLSDRSIKLKSYDINVSKARMNELNGYTISMYLAILSSMYIIQDASMPSQKLYPNAGSFIPVSIAYLLFTSATIANYFNLRKIVPGLNYDSTKIIKKTTAEKAKETTEQKVQTQNVLLTAYYGILNFFNPANL
jgi:hypothetical protein